MNKRPKRLKQINHNLTREIAIPSFDKQEENSIISDGASSVSRLFPHVTKRKTDTINPSMEAYTNQKMNFVFQ
jgi:hypothetical protein